MEKITSAANELQLPAMCCTAIHLFEMHIHQEDCATLMARNHDVSSASDGVFA